jgi:hypothetical protein
VLGNKKVNCPFDLENPNCNSKLANSQYEKALKESSIYKRMMRDAIEAKKRNRK